jgi:transcriptional regulator with XRE-family HTH domain
LKSINSPMYRALGKVVNAARITAKMTQKEVAEKLDWPQNRISDIERGRRRVEVSELEEIAWAMGADSVELFRAARDGAGAAISAQRHRVKARLRTAKKSR